MLKENFYNPKNWTIENIDSITKTSIHCFKLNEETRKFLSGSHGFVFTFNLATNGTSYCTQIAFDHFNYVLIKRNGYPENDIIKWNNWDKLFI